jgi:hypothetical protein
MYHIKSNKIWSDKQNTFVNLYDPQVKNKVWISNLLKYLIFLGYDSKAMYQALNQLHNEYETFSIGYYDNVEKELKAVWIILK